MIYLCTIDGSFGMLTHFFYKNKIIKSVTTSGDDIIAFDVIYYKYFEMTEDFEYELPSKLNMITNYTGYVYDLCYDIVLSKILIGL